MTCRHCHARPAVRRKLCWGCWRTPGIRNRYRPKYKRTEGETMADVEAIIASVKAEGRPSWWHSDSAHHSHDPTPIYTPRVVRLRGRRGGVRS